MSVRIKFDTGGDGAGSRCSSEDSAAATAGVENLVAGDAATLDKASVEIVGLLRCVHFVSEVRNVDHVISKGVEGHVALRGK